MLCVSGAGGTTPSPGRGAVVVLGLWVPFRAAGNSWRAWGRSAGTVWIFATICLALYGFRPPLAHAIGIEKSNPRPIGATEATLHALLDPDGETITSCTFEVQATEPAGDTAFTPCTTYPGGGSSFAPVTGTITGLEPGRKYRVGIEVRDSRGGGAGWSVVSYFTTAGHPAVPIVATQCEGECPPPSGIAVGRTEVTFFGLVDAEWAEVTDCRFEFGPTVAYGSSASCLGSLEGFEGVTQRVSAATAVREDETYHLRLVATNSLGTSVGGDYTFYTGLVHVVTGEASQNGAAHVILHGTFEPKGSADSECYFEGSTAAPPGFYRSGCEGLIWDAETKTFSVSAPIVGPPGYTSHYRLIVRNEVGVAYGDEKSVTFLASTKEEEEREQREHELERAREREGEAQQAEEQEEDARAEFEGYGKFVIEGYESAIGLLAVRNPPGTTVEALSDQAIDETGLPAGSLAVVGGVSYSLMGLPPGTSVDAKFDLPPDSHPTSVFKFTKGKWEDETHLATIVGDTITFHVRDGGEGDEDGVANGVIVDPMVPVRLASPPVHAEIGRCGSAPASKEGSKTVYGGEYHDSKCSKDEAGGKYRWKAGAIQRGFTASGSKVSVETSAKVKISCTGSSASGEITGQTGENMQLTLSGCSGPNKAVCTTPGQQAGVILSSLLGGTVGFIDASKGTVGVKLAPVESSSPNVAEFECGATEERLTGSVVGQLKTVGKMSSSLQLQFKGKRGVQTLEGLEGEPVDTLGLSSGPPEAAHSEPADLSTKITQHHLEALEVKNKS